MQQSENLVLGFTGIDHPALAAENVEKLSDWYCKVLGYERWYRHRNVEPLKKVWMLRAPDGTLLEIMPEDDANRPERTTWTPGWSHIALRVADIDIAVEYLDTCHIVWGGELVDAIGGGRVRNFFDPEGNMLQIVERAGH